MHINVQNTDLAPLNNAYVVCCSSKQSRNRQQEICGMLGPGMFSFAAQSWQRQHSALAALSVVTCNMEHAGTWYILQLTCWVLCHSCHQRALPAWGVTCTQCSQEQAVCLVIHTDQYPQLFGSPCLSWFARCSSPAQDQQHGHCHQSP